MGRLYECGGGGCRKSRKPKMVWKRPELGFYKLNVDEAIKGKLGLVGIGRVVHDYSSKMLLAFLKPTGVRESN